MSPRNGSCVAEVSSVRSLSSDDVSAAKANQKKSCWARATDPAHRRGRRIQLLQMLVLPFIPILALIVQTANTLHDILIYRQEVSDIEAQVSHSRCDEFLLVYIAMAKSIRHPYSFHLSEILSPVLFPIG